MIIKLEVVTTKTYKVLFDKCCLEKKQKEHLQRFLVNVSRKLSQHITSSNATK